MSPLPPRRKVLIVEDEPSIRNMMYVLIAGLRFDGEIVANGADALAKIGKEEYDAVLLDLRCGSLIAEDVIPQIQNIQPSLVGRVLVITAETTDPKAAQILERHLVRRIPGSRVRQDLLRALISLLFLPPQSKPAN